MIGYLLGQYFWCEVGSSEVSEIQHVDSVEQSWRQIGLPVQYQWQAN